MPTATKSRPAPPASRTKNNNGPKSNAPPQAQVAFGKITAGVGHRIVTFGPGGVGKTSLSATAPGPVAFFDLDDSLSVLGNQLDGLDIRLVTGIDSWSDLRAALHSPGWDAVKTIVIDSATQAEELAIAYTLKTVPHEKGNKIERIEDYGYGKGYVHVYEVFLTLLADLDQHVRAGRHVILVCHDCVSNVPNPSGDDWIRYEPRLQSPASGKSSIRLRVREWADHLLFLGYDITVKDGKASGCGSRTIYPNELPHCMAKSRTLDEPLELEYRSAELWEKLFGTNSK